jgi:transcriptional regulator with XRE-family HTH domain
MTMAIDFFDLGERLRAYRLGAGLTPEDVARRLKISRAALYKYEKGGLIKLETIEKLAALLEVSVPSLLGVGVEYFANAVAYYERKRQIEQRAEQVIVYFEPLSFTLTSPEYVGHLRTMLLESIPEGFVGRTAAVDHVERVMRILEQLHAHAREGHAGTSIVSLVSANQVQRFLRSGLIGTFNLPPDVRDARRRAARREVERFAALMENEPIGVQIGVIEDTMPNQTFQIFRERQKTWVAISPFRLGEFPNVSLGVASITSAPEAVTLYEKLSGDLWQRAQKGPRGADLLRRIVAESTPEPKAVANPVSSRPSRATAS